MKFIQTRILKKVLASIGIIFFWTVASNAASLQNVVIISIDALHPAALNAGTTPTIYGDGEMLQGAYTLDGGIVLYRRVPDPPDTIGERAKELRNYYYQRSWRS